MKKVLFASLSCTLCLSLMIGCNKTPYDKNEITYITMDSFDEKGSETSSIDEGLVATIYTTDSESLNLIDKEVNISAITPESILEQLKSCQVVPENTQINNFKTYTSEDNLSVGILDFSKDFYNFNLGSGFESMMLNSVAQTYIDNFELHKLKILVDGSEYQSGHILFEKGDYFIQEDLN